MKIIRIFCLQCLIITFIICVSTQISTAQLTGFQTMYFDNQYLVNPAMAGLDMGLTINAGYQNQWKNIPGGPKLQNLTAEFNGGNNVGLGLTINNDAAGLISDTRVMGTYAYHAPVSEMGNLNFGVSFGLNDSYVDQNKIIGDQNDLTVALFNGQKIYLDGDAGVSYTSNSFNLQVAVPNLGSTLFNVAGSSIAVDRLTFFSSVSYNFAVSNQDNGFTLEPKLAYRGIKGFPSIIDGGANFVMEGVFNVSAMYHSNQSITVGAGIDVKPFRLLFSYGNNIGQLRSYANNTFEIGVRFSTGSKSDQKNSLF